MFISIKRVTPFFKISTFEILCCSMMPAKKPYYQKTPLCVLCYCWHTGYIFIYFYTTPSPPFAQQTERVCAGIEKRGGREKRNLQPFLRQDVRRLRNTRDLGSEARVLGTKWRSRSQKRELALARNGAMGGAPKFVLQYDVSYTTI